jgi:hypothetical protein
LRKNIVFKRKTVRKTPHTKILLRRSKSENSEANQQGGGGGRTSYLEFSHDDI